MAIVTYIFILMLVAGGIFLIIKAVSSGNPREPFYGRPVYYDNQKTGQRYRVQVDFQDITNIKKIDHNTGREYINAEGYGLFAKSKKIFYDTYTQL